MNPSRRSFLVAGVALAFATPAGADTDGPELGWYSWFDADEPGREPLALVVATPADGDGSWRR